MKFKFTNLWNSEWQGKQIDFIYIVYTWDFMIKEKHRVWVTLFNFEFELRW